MFSTKAPSCAVALALACAVGIAGDAWAHTVVLGSSGPR
jgi:hypothetical protein